MKTKTFKRLAAAVAAITMMCAVPMMSMPVNIISAANADRTITIDAVGDNVSRGYSIYQIFTGDVSGTGNTAVLSNIVWGTGVDSTNLITDIRTANTSSTSVLKGKFDSLPANTSASDIANKLVGMSDDELQEFSKIALKNKNTSSGDVTVSASAVAVNNLLPGYYLIVETTANAAADNAKSANMVKVIDSQTVTPKVDHPTLSKSIKTGEDAQNNNNPIWGDANTASIGDSVTYKLESKVPDMTGYNEYFFVVNDKLSPGLELGSPSSFTVTIHDSGNNRSDQTLTNQTGAQNQYSASGFYVETYKTTYSGDNTSQYDNAFRLVINDLKALQPRAGDEIIITYSAYLGGQNGQYAADVKYGTAVAAANTNTANLIYSNDPNHTYNGTPAKPYEPPMDDNGPNSNDDTPNDPTDDTPKSDDPSSKTPPDTVYTYTSQLKINKLDGANSNNPLNGAGFAIYKGILNNGTITYDASPLYEIKSTQQTPISVFEFKGLDSGLYKIVETQVPAGYNKADDIEFEIIGTIQNDNTVSWSKNGSNLISVTNSLYNADIVNNAGTTLPSTGGIGTTIFYVSGGALILGAGIVLVTKKRMSLKDDK